MLKATGIVRRLDHLGRLVLPVELRRSLSLEAPGAAVEIFTHGEQVVLKRYEPLCVFCGNGGGLMQHQGKQVCETCRTSLAAGVH